LDDSGSLLSDFSSSLAPVSHAGDGCSLGRHTIEQKEGMPLDGGVHQVVTPAKQAPHRPGRECLLACLLACLFVFLRENSLQLEGYREIKAAAAECKALLVKLGATADKLMSHLLLAEFEALVNLHDDTLVSYLQTQVIPSARGNTRLWLQLCGIRLAAFSPVSVSFSFAK